MVYCKLKIPSGGKQSRGKPVSILQEHLAVGATISDAISACQELGNT